MIQINLNGDEVTDFSTVSGALIATGYTRIIVEDSKSYVEFDERHLNIDEFCICSDIHSDYIELRTLRDSIKTYAQLRIVNHTNYKPGMYYISTLELYVNGNMINDLTTSAL